MNATTLRAFLWIRRVPPLPSMGLLFVLAGSILLAIVVPGEVRQLRTLERQRTQGLIASAEPARAAPDRAFVRWERFEHHLGDPATLPAQLQAIYGLAARSGLMLSAGEYKLTDDPSGAYSAYQVRLPVEGDYRAVRRFCEDVLLAMPHAALDELTFKRDLTASGTLQAKTQFTLFLAPASGSMRPSPPAGASR